MNKSISCHSRLLCSMLILSAGISTSLAPRGAAQSTSQDPKPAPSSTATQSTPSTPATPEQTEAQKKAAERKRRFEEQKALLDGGGGKAGAGATATHAPVTDSEFYMEPIAVNMVAGETQELSVWDRRGTGNDVSARVSWDLSDPSIVDMTVNRHATISAKMPGTATVTGRLDGHTVEAVITVHRGEKLPWGVPRTVSAPPVPRTGGRRNTMTVIESPN